MNMNADQLNRAFANFTAASRTLESSYEVLQNRVQHLTLELDSKNRELTTALADAEESKDYLQAVLYNIEEAIIVVDPDRRVTMINRSAERLLGISAGDVLDKSSGLDLNPAPADNGDSHLTINGRRYTVIFSHSDVVDASGKLRGSVLLLKDVTRIREIELRNERNERLIAMGEMAAKIVHEIRNPLCSIDLFSSMLEKELKDPAQRTLAAGISSGIGSLNTILTNMLIFARPHRPELRPIRLDTVITESLALVRPHLELRNITLCQSLSAAKINGDGELLKQVFVNVLINAAQAVDAGGTIELSTGEQDGGAMVQVRDDGIGIPPEHLEKIFDPFFSTKDAGTGLGLAISSTIVQLHGGFITVESESGKGTTFRLSFLKGPATQTGPKKLIDHTA